MTLNRTGQSTILLPNRPRLIASAAIAGKKEGEGPLGDRQRSYQADHIY